MNVLVIGSDPRIFEHDSESFLRAREYAGLFGEYHVVSSAPAGAEPYREGNLFLWPASSRFFLFWPLYAFTIGRNIARQRKIDVVDAQDAGECGIVAFCIARGLKKPFRVQIHTDIMSPYYHRASWKEYCRYLLALFLIPRADCIRAVSGRIKRSIETRDKRQETKISVLPIFTDMSRFISAALNPETERRFKDYNFKMIAAGRLVDKEKNFSMLIDVMRIFARISPQALLVIVGDGRDRTNCESRIRNYGLEKNVILEPWRDDLPSFYKSFDLFVSASNYEGWGRAVIEAMAVGLPVVMTDAGLAGEVVKNNENGIVVPVGDRQAFSTAIQMLYENPEKRLQIARAGQETAKNLKPATRKEYLARYWECLESCAGETKT